MTAFLGLKLGLIASFAICTGCNGGRVEQPVLALSAMAVLASSAVPVAEAVRAGVPRAATPPTAALASASAEVAPRAAAARVAAPGKMKLERFVIATGIEDREPRISSEPLPSDGTAIYAFAELANPEGESENVRVTFERKGGSERVGDVTLPVPGKVSRHRTWAFTRFIRAAGVWEAVLWSEAGAELGRTSFEVKAS